jgi:exodeoxyribonuclease V beta subunit
MSAPGRSEALIPKRAARRVEELDVFTCPLAGIRRIEASAGTGKTWNICGLYLRLLLEAGLEVQRILVVTFTNAATAELRERIRQRIVDTLAWLRPDRGAPAGGGDAFVERLVETLRTRRGLDDDTLAARLELALSTFDEASIFTIHGFCQRALADTPFTAQMPLAQELARDDMPWIREAAADFWRRQVGGGAMDPALADHLLARKDSPERWAALLKRHLAKPMASSLWPEGIDGAAAGADAAALRGAHDQARATWSAQHAGIAALLWRAWEDDHLAKNVYREESLRTAIANWDAVLQEPDGAAALACPADKLDLLGAARLAACTKKNGTTPRHAFFDEAEALLRARAQAASALELRRLGLLRALLHEGAQAQRAAKRHARVVAFDDMLANLHARLAGSGASWLAGALRERFPAALIDEFQDTDPLQFAIFEAIYARPAALAPAPARSRRAPLQRELFDAPDAHPEPDADAPADPAADRGPLFFVGDPKQAIYSFRNADLHTYLAAGRVAEGHYSLVENQRSTGPLIAALNALFGANPRAFMLEDLVYQAVKLGAKPRQPLVDRSAGGAGAAALQVWMLPADEASGEPLPQRDAQAAVVDATAAEIARTLAAAQRGEITLGAGAGERPLAAGDIAVLVRSNAQGSLIRHALTALGVGSVELSQASVFATVDAEELDRVLAAVLEPAREQFLRAALATEAMGWEADRIDALAADEAAMLAEVQRFAAWRDTWLQRGIGFMLRQWMGAAEVTARLLARPDGERRLTNLLHLVECLHEAAETHAAPDALLRWLQTQRAGGAGAGDEATQLRLESDRNLVQIVTIHKSKGLEYPLVFCPFLWSPEILREGDDERDAFEYHDDAGTAVIDFRKRLLDDGARKDLRLRMRLERSAETLRLVYVALTRAVHRCVLVAGCCTTRPGGRPSAKASTQTMLNWLVAGAGMTPQEWLRHEGGVPLVASAWEALAASAAGGAIAVGPLPATPAIPLQVPRAAPDALAALEPPRPLPVGWWMGSFSGLAHGAAPERSAVDHDLHVVDDDAGPRAAAPVPTARPAGDDVLRFPRGPAAGECIHQVFERIDFTQPQGWPVAIEQALRLLRVLGAADAVDAADAAGIDPAAAGPGAAPAAMLRRMLDDVLATPLPLGTATPLRLADLPPERRLIELEFHLPVARLDAAALNDLLARQGYGLPRLAFATLRGYLKGFIDLVFEHEGRYFILDWKSNHLGDTPADYGPHRLAAVMRDQAYHLQHLIYGVALDRYLRTRLPGYRPERHFGGAVYLFVRGVRPGWVDDQGRPAGVFFHRPDPETMQRLSVLFDPVEAVR